MGAVLADPSKSCVHPHVADRRTSNGADFSALRDRGFGHRAIALGVGQADVIGGDGLMVDVLLRFYDVQHQSNTI